MELDFGFTEEDMVVNETLGYPKAFAKLCRDRSVGSYSNGPPFTFTPYSLPQEEARRAEEFEQMFPVLDPKARATAKPKIFVSLLWKQLSHLGNAGFDPAVVRVDPYGNVLYYHADSASPLAWEIDHWFPCSRGGLTVPSNLRLLQWQACKKKHNKLEFLIPWWDFQLGISVNQFLSVFASSNSDFRHRAFSFLFAEGENEEVNEAQTVQSHSFPHHFIESKEKVGLAPASIVVSHRELSRSSSPLRTMDYNSQPRAHQTIPLVAARKVRPGHFKENENPNQVLNPYQAIVMARDSLKLREEKAKMQVELEELDNEVVTMKRKNEDEKIAIQDLELTLIKRRRRAEKCRRLAEAQSSYRTMLEKMIRDAMHQSVIYKEQVRLNQAATNSLMARLEAQKAICDASEKALHKIHKQKDEIQTQIRPEWEQARKRSRMDDTLVDEHQEKEPILCLPGVRPRTPLHKELRVFLEEEHKATEAQLNLREESKNKGSEEQQLLADNIYEEEPENHGCKEVEISTKNKLESLHVREGQKHKITFPIIKELEREEDGESRKLRGKENVERWLQMLLENAPDELQDEDQNLAEATDGIIRKLNKKYPQKEETRKFPGVEEKKGAEKTYAANQEKNAQETITKEDIVEPELANSPTQRDKPNGRDDVVMAGRKSESFESKDKLEKGGREKGLVRSESARLLRRIPSSPLLVVKKGVDCIRKKPLVIGDDDDDYYYGQNNVGGNSFMRTSFMTIKRAVKK